MPFPIVSNVVFFGLLDDRAEAVAFFMSSTIWDVCSSDAR